MEWTNTVEFEMQFVGNDLHQLTLNLQFHQQFYSAEQHLKDEGTKIK